ncbi:MAG TPA: R3H domain-containing nucleic acid-binding protein [Verrucomicrobiales bacterium]|nr:R3H domain-containing nucleic acid-binding protein [Verrucomicrobiales bacterium]
MNAVTAAQEILEIMLRHLGYTAEVAVDAECEVPGLQVTVEDAKAASALTGKRGERLDDIQHLVNKLLRQKLPDAPRVRVDVNHFRDRKDDSFLNEVRSLADKVRSSGHPIKLDPMNSYQRRLVHNLFKDDPAIRTWSPEDDSRMKRITLLPRNS